MRRLVEVFTFFSDLPFSLHDFLQIRKEAPGGREFAVWIIEALRRVSCSESCRVGPRGRRRLAWR